MTTLGAALLAVGACFWSGQAFAQTTTSVTTTRGAFTEYVPGSETVVVRSEAASPLRYSVTKQTTIVDETGAPVAIERISPGSPLSVQYTGTGEHLVASRIIVQKPTTVVAPVTTGAVVAPVTSGAAVTDQQTSTTVTRPVTHDEKHALHEQREHEKKAAKKQIEAEKDALDKAKDKLDDD